MEDRMIPIGDRYRSALHRSVTMVRCKNSDPMMMDEEDAMILVDEED